MRFSSFFSAFLFCVCFWQNVNCLSKEEKKELKALFLKKYAYPADELMPLSCKGRYRDAGKSRGDIDEVLGNYTLTLVDSLDTLAVLGRVDEFEDAVKKVLITTHFDRDLVVSVFESNIRMLGGLISGHVSLIYLRDKHFPKKFEWYKDELLFKAKDLAYRLLPAFNTSTGLPMSRVNLRHGVTSELLLSEKDKFTCTACAGTLLLEFAVLSRLTGEKVFEEKVIRTMDYIWEKRNRASDLVGTTINVNDGEWLVKDSSIGAGIDSYYEYLFKGYILLGDENLLYRFNKHYDAIMKYMSLNSNDGFEHGDGSCLKTVHMHMPNRQARNYIDALLAFWPGLQVLKGDLKAAIKMHEALHQIVQKHDFLPEAVLFDHSVHWSSHPLRPEFLESTYYLYRATKDNHYLEIAKKMVFQLEKYSRVACGYAAIADVKTKQHEDRMDSFVYAETFKYLYLMFAEDDEMLFDIDEFVFSTEAHLLPLDLKRYAHNKTERRAPTLLDQDEQTWRAKSCPSLEYLFDSTKSQISTMTQKLRDSVSKVNERRCSQQQQQQQHQFSFQSTMSKVKNMPLRAGDFVAGRKEHVDILKKMGIKITSTPDGRVQLVHRTDDADSLEEAEKGILFMTEMLELSKQQNFQLKTSVQMDDYRPLSVVLVSAPFDAKKEYTAGPAQFGADLKHGGGFFGRLVLSKPIDACSPITNPTQLKDKILVAKRGNCMFIEKARQVEETGAVGLIIVDNQNETSHANSPLFAMSGDGVNNVSLPSLFLFGKEGNQLISLISQNKEIIAFIGDNSLKHSLTGIERALTFNPGQLKFILTTKFNEQFSLKTSHLKDRFEVFQGNKVRNVCVSSDYELMRHYLDLFAPRKIEDEEEIQVVEFDDVIELGLLEDEKRELIIHVDVLLGSELGLAGTRKGSEYAEKVFDSLRTRFEAKTNLESLSDKLNYKKSLFNLVSAELAKAKLNNEDKLVLDKFANELDFKENSTDNIIIKTVKRPKNKN